MSKIYLSRIAINDFRTFGQFEIDIPAAPGLVLLTGTNGLGKSSFFDAIEWCLTNQIRRFEPYLQKGRKKLAESDYLTRRGANAGAHRVSLTFSGAQPIERSAAGGATIANVIAQLLRPNRKSIEDLATYLALTHFSGQSATERFTNRDAKDQWEALKRPSGIERLERIRDGLRGRSTVMAFTRRIEQEKDTVTSVERQIADWQGWMMRLDRLKAAARATGAFTEAETVARIDALESELLPMDANQTAVIVGEGVGHRLARLGDRIEETLQTFSEKRSALEALAPVVEQFLTYSADARQDDPRLLRLRDELASAKDRVGKCTSAVDAAKQRVSAQEAAIAAILLSVSVLEESRRDLARRAQLIELIGGVETEHTTVVRTITGHRVALETADQALKSYADASADLARLRSLVTSAKALDDSLADYLSLESDLGLAISSLAPARAAADAAAIELGPLEVQLVDLQARIGDAQRARVEAEHDASVISDALSQLASHIHDDDTDCPVCHTRFDPGVLRALAEAAASSSDDRLAKADEVLKNLRKEETGLISRIAGLRNYVSASIEHERKVAAATAEVTNARAAIAKTLGVSSDSDLVHITAERARGAMEALSAAEAALAPLAADAAAATEQRSAMSALLDELISRESILGTRLSELKAEDAACADRIAARNLSAATLTELDDNLSTQREQLETARVQLTKLSDAADIANAAAQSEQSALDAVQRDLALAEAKRESAEQSSQQIAARWTNAGLADTPSQARYEGAHAGIESAISTLRSLADRRQVLAQQNENALIQGEVDEVLAAMRTVGGDAGVEDAQTYLVDLQAKLEAARAAVKLTTGARTAVRRYSEGLQTQADDFARRVLNPLNDVIGDFNEAMLSAPGESIEFTADTRVDTTTLGMALRSRDRFGHTGPGAKDLPPQVVLSEGQLAANGFSILCAASTAYPWSRWRALLLDDPLQHNDIIHKAAFVDVMRNMVELDGYQIVMSSHDRGEADFIARKFDAAGLPCTRVTLTAPSDSGVIWSGPEQNQAASRVLHETARALNADTA
jgi:DNA repair exonuclease SbcCD ATPase subunit